MVEIINQVFHELQVYGYDSPKKKLIAGIVLTGGGSQLKHIKQLVEYITGIDTRIGFPNEHLAGNSGEQFSSPIFATAVGLIIQELKNKKINIQETKKEVNNIQNIDSSEIIVEQDIQSKNEHAKEKTKNRYMDSFFKKLKDFLDNAE